MSFNLVIYAVMVRKWIPDIGKDDMSFVCNKSSNIHKRVESHGCVDNYRISRVVDGDVSDDYRAAKHNGCCGFVDEIFTNPKTGNSFTIGFNFGH